MCVCSHSGTTSLVDYVGERVWVGFIITRSWPASHFLSQPGEGEGELHVFFTLSSLPDRWSFSKPNWYTLSIPGTRMTLGGLLFTSLPVLGVCVFFY